MDLKKFILDIPDFPKPGILFRDITPLLKNWRALEEAIHQMAVPHASSKITHVVGLESRGFIFGSLLASRLAVGFIPARKPGKLPRATCKAQYGLEYGRDQLEIHEEDISPGMNILLVDDLLATGGSLNAAHAIVLQLGATVVGASVLIELEGLSGRHNLDAALNENTTAVLKY